MRIVDIGSCSEIPEQSVRCLECLECLDAGAASFACGEPISADILAAGDNCSYAGPATIDLGRLPLLHLTSLGHNQLILASLEERHSSSELETHL